ncbi:MAG: stage 0 sporulation protein, partial [Alkaliphilus sp.]|nr:stage 0 sporulation protein [Alkaliphilus sp.]
GEGVVIGINVLLELIRVKINDSDGPDGFNDNNDGIRTYSLHDVTKIKEIETGDELGLSEELEYELKELDEI